MHLLALRRVAQTGLSAETLPLSDHGFDTIVCTYTLCSIPDPATALTEMRRELAPGASCRSGSTAAAPDESVRRWQQQLQPLWGPFAGGCQLGRGIPALLEAADLRLAVQSMDPLGPRFTSHHYRGEAVPR